MAPRRLHSGGPALGAAGSPARRGDRSHPDRRDRLSRRVSRRSGLGHRGGHPSCPRDRERGRRFPRVSSPGGRACPGCGSGCRPRPGRRRRAAAPRGSPRRAGRRRCRRWEGAPRRPADAPGILRSGLGSASVTRRQTLVCALAGAALVALTAGAVALVRAPLPPSPRGPEPGPARSSRRTAPPVTAPPDAETRGGRASLPSAREPREPGAGVPTRSVSRRADPPRRVDLRKAGNAVLRLRAQRGGDRGSHPVRENAATRAPHLGTSRRASADACAGRVDAGAEPRRRRAGARW